MPYIGMVDWGSGLIGSPSWQSQTGRGTEDLPWRERESDAQFIAPSCLQRSHQDDARCETQGRSEKRDAPENYGGSGCRMACPRLGVPLLICSLYKQKTMVLHFHDDSRECHEKVFRVAVRPPALRRRDCYAGPRDHTGEVHFIYRNCYLGRRYLEVTWTNS